MLSRKQFLVRSGLAAGLMLLGPAMLKGRNQFPARSGRRNLFFAPEDIPEIRRRLSLPLFSEAWAKQLNADVSDDVRFLETGVDFNDQLRHLPRICNILQRDAFIYVITGRADRGGNAKLALQRLLQFRKWDYFLEAGKDVIGLQRAPLATQSVVLAYEWIEELLPEEMRQEVMRQLPEKGIEPCYRSCWGMLHKEAVVGWSFDPESTFLEEPNRDLRRWPWILAGTNLHAVPLSALGLGAVFMLGRHPRGPEWWKVLKAGFEDFKGSFARDGSYAEGTGYCNYTALELAHFLHVLCRHTDEDWSNQINWRGLMDYYLMTRMPSGQHPEGHVNFGDGGDGYTADLAFWIARRFEDPHAQYAGLLRPIRDPMFAAVYYDPEIMPARPAGAWFYRHYDIGWVVISTGFSSDDFVAALRSGGPANHEHADRNSVIMKCHEENLLVDNWHPPYDNRNPAWSLRTSPAHNTVLIDGRGHQYHDGAEGTNPSQAMAKVVREITTEHYAIVTSDATPAYALVDQNIGAINRTLLCVPGIKLLLVVDTMHAKVRPATFNARWFVENEDKQGTIEIDGARFYFHRPKAKLAGICAATTGVRLTRDLFPVPSAQGIFPYLDVTAEAASTSGIITAMFALQQHESVPPMKLTSAAEGWVFTASLPSRNISVKITLTDDHPALNVSLS
jgi:hypothetical protein